MTAKEQKTMVAWLTITTLVLGLGAAIWGMSASNTKRDVTVEFHEQRVQRLEVLIEKVRYIPVMDEKIKNIEKSVRKIERKLR